MSYEPDYPPVYLFTIDSLRADFFDEEHFPSCWERFSSDFTRFSNAYANGIATPLAFPSILADDLVTGNGVLDPGATALAERFPDPSIAVRNNVHLSEERGYHRGFSQFDVDIDAPGYAQRALALRCFRQNVLKRLRRQIPLLRDPVVPIPYRSAERMTYEIKRAMQEAFPGFLWAHFMDPHGPYHPDLIFDRESTITFGHRGFEYVQRQWDANDELDEEAVEKVVRIYDEKIRYLDRQLHQLFEWLKTRDWYDDALIVVTADHGQLLGENGRYNHKWYYLPVDELLRVPLLVKYPDDSQGGEVLTHPVQHLDIHPTVARYTPNNLDSNPDGRALTDPGDRFILAKSNSGVRGISATGDVMREKDGEPRVNGDPDPALVERARSETPATVTNDVGQGLMSDDERERVNQRLEQLGYL